LSSLIGNQIYVVLANQFSPSTGTSLRHNGKKQEDLSFCCFSLGFNAANY